MNTANDADVLIIGGGLAGMSAGGRATLAGLKTIVIEKGDEEDYICNSRIAGGVFNLAHSDPMSPPDVLREAIAGDTEGYANPQLAAAVADVAAEAMTWLRAEGAKFVRVQRPNSSARWSMAPPRPARPASLLKKENYKGRGPDYALRCLTKGFKERGGQMRLGVRAQDLLFENGSCAGVKAIEGGREITLRAPNVLIADGGFQANVDLVGRFIAKKPRELTQRNARTGMGDGLLMAERAGAKLTPCDRFYGHLLVQESITNEELWPWPTLDTIASNAIVVNMAGRRFLDEGLGGIPLTNMIAQLEDPLSATVIFDHPIWDRIGKLEHTPPNPLMVNHGGTVTSADTIEQLAIKVGIDAAGLRATVDGYNTAIERDTIDKLEPKRSPGRMFATLRSSNQRMPVAQLKTAPFYAVRIRPGITYTMGGIAINDRAEVLDQSGKPMPGLYAAGACTGGLEGGPIAGYIGGLNKALTLGFIAARSVAMRMRGQAG